MNSSIHLSDTLARRLQQIAQETGRSRDTLVREAVESWLARREQRRWPDEGNAIHTCRVFFNDGYGVEDIHQAITFGSHRNTATAS